MKGNPAVPEGSLTSKPTWWNTFGCPTTSAFFSLALARDGRDHEGGTDEQVRPNHGAADRASCHRLRATEDGPRTPVGGGGGGRGHAGDHAARGAVARREGPGEKPGGCLSGAGVSPATVHQLRRRAAAGD